MAEARLSDRLGQGASVRDGQGWYDGLGVWYEVKWDCRAIAVESNKESRRGITKRKQRSLLVAGG